MPFCRDQLLTIQPSLANMDLAPATPTFVLRVVFHLGRSILQMAQSFANAGLFFFWTDASLLHQ